MHNLVGYFDHYWNPEIVHLRYSSSIHILYVHDTFIFFSAVITPCASGNVLLKAHWFYCIKHLWKITHLLSTYFPLTQIYIPCSILQVDFTIFVHEFSDCTKYLPYFKITQSLHTFKIGFNPYSKIFVPYYTINIT